MDHFHSSSMMNNKDIKKVMIGLSGGVDSSVAAYLLKKANVEVIAGFMRNWDAFANNDILGNPTLQDDICPQEEDYNDALLVAKQLDIPLYRIDFIKEYWEQVFTYFLAEYKQGRTPNPDIFCNKYIKFSAFADFAKKHKCTHIAMGHYAGKQFSDGQYHLKKCLDKEKDQTYFLSQINQQQLAMTLFPLANITKTEVRRIAKNLKLPIADKKDSTGVCFIGERHFKQFLSNYLPAKPGIIVDIMSNEQIGEHQGVFYYTIGQRRGLGIGGIKGREPTKWFVAKKDVKKNILYVASNNENEYLLADQVYINKTNWISQLPIVNQIYGCKFRYRQKEVAVKVVYIDEQTITLDLVEPYKAITPGQGAVLYDHDYCLGGGIIDVVYRKGKRIN
jgi:tRNA-uridine 2-sulfurtransferase